MASTCIVNHKKREWIPYLPKIGNSKWLQFGVVLEGKFLTLVIDTAVAQTI